MFTGIVTNTAKVIDWNPTKNGGVLSIKPIKKISRIKLGDSIAINGICLTVIKIKNGTLAFDVSDETMRKTALHQYQKGGVVNLERPMLASERFGGHFVLGHVDGVGTIKGIKTNIGSVEFTIAYPKKFAKLLIEKGSVTVDGISLTICNLTNTTFDLYIIPHTLKETNMGAYRVGTQVNLEFDVLGKYIQRLMKPSF